MADQETRMTWLARGGLAAKAVVYCTIGILALQAAFGAGATPESSTVGHQLGALGEVLLWITAIGLFCYALWRGAQALGISHEQRDPDQRKEAAKRVAAAGSACANAGLGVLFILIALGSGGGGGGAWSGLLDSLWGRLLVGAVGIGLIAAGGYQFVVAKRESFMRGISSGSSTVQRTMRRLGKLAFAARGVVFAIIGGGLVVSAVQAARADFSSLGGALAQLGEQPYGTWLLAAVALGLFAYGIVSAVMSRYVRAQA